MANYNFLKQAQVYLVEPTNYGPLAHYFKFDNLTSGLVDPINAKTATLAQRASYETTVTTDTPTQIPNAGSLFFVEEGKGGQLLSREDCNTWEDTTGSWSASIWFRSETFNGQSQARLFSRDFSDGWGLRVNQSVASGSQGIIMTGQPGSFNPGFNLDVDTWYHAVVVHTGTFGTTINSGGSYVNGASYEIVALGDQNDAYWESINADSGAGDNAHEVGSKFIATSGGTLAGSGAIIREYTTALSLYMNGVLQDAAGGATSITNVRTNEAAGLGLGANTELSGQQTGQNFKGSMSDIRLYTTALTQAEVSSLYTGTGIDVGTITKLEVGPELSFSQTFTDSGFTTKTVHTEDFFESSSIKKANPANFSFVLPVIQETDFEVVKDKLVDCSTFDLYVETGLDVFKLEKAVFTGGTFNIQRDNPLTLSLSGEASKLTLVGSATSYVIPGLSVAQSVRTHLLNKELKVTLNSTDLSTNIYSIKAELQNDINWTPYTTVNEALSVTNATNAMYPTNFTVNKKTLAGSIGQYITDTTSSDLQDFTTGESLRIQAGESIHTSNPFPGIDINMASCSFTNRAKVEEVFTQSYDWRSTDNLTALSSIITI